MENIENNVVSTGAVDNNAVSNNAVSDNTTSTSEVKPDYVLPDKFKTVNDLISSYSKLENKLGGFYGAPDEYKWELDGQEPDQVKLFKEVAKENNLSQIGFNKIVSGYLSKEKAVVEAQMKQMEDDRKSIGDERINRTINLIKNLNLEQKDLMLLDKFISGKSEFELVEKVLSKINDTVNSVTANNIPAVDPAKELEAIYNKPDYRYNASKYHADILKYTKMKLERGV